MTSLPLFPWRSLVCLYYLVKSDSYYFLSKWDHFRPTLSGFAFTYQIARIQSLTNQEEQFTQRNRQKKRSYLDRSCCIKKCLMRFTIAAAGMDIVSTVEDYCLKGMHFAISRLGKHHSLNVRFVF